MRKVIFFILLSLVVLNIPAKKIAEFDDIYKPRQIEISGDDLYVVDGETIKLFSFKELKLIKQIGKKGEGPGEFKFWPRISLSSDGLFALDRGPLSKKIVLFTGNGEFISERKLPRSLTLYKVKQNYLAKEYKSDFNSKESTSIVKILDKDLKLVKTIYTDTEKIDYSGYDGNSKINFEKYAKGKWIDTDGEYVYVVDTHKGFFIEIYNHIGDNISTITKNVNKIPCTQDDRNKFMERLRKGLNWDYMKKRYNFIFPEYFPAIRDIEGDNNKIYVSTYKDLNNTIEIIIMDHKGNILRKSYVPRAHPSDIHNDKFYYLKDNEDEEVWELHVEDL